MTKRRESITIFNDRAEAGAALAQALVPLELENPLILAMPRGGVPVAAPIALRLNAELDVIVARKLGAPGQPELAVGAVAENGVVLVERAAVDGMGVNEPGLEQMVSDAQAELFRRVALYRGTTPPLDVAGRDVVVVDDGVATGFTARAALDSIQAMNPLRLVLAVPVCPRSAVGQFNDIELVCLSHPHPFESVGRWYRNFGQVSDAEVLAVLGMQSGR